MAEKERRHNIEEHRGTNVAASWTEEELVCKNKPLEFVAMAVEDARCCCPFSGTPTNLGN